MMDIINAYFANPSYLNVVFYTSFFAFIFASIPFGLLLTRLFGYGDIRKIGSGNIGATNVLRTGNKKLAAFTLLLDSLKGMLFIFFAAYQYQKIPMDYCKKAWDANIGCIPSLVSYETSHFLLIIGLFAILGHCYPLWLKFKGGKGVATTLGVLLAAVPFSGMLTCLTWLISAKFGKISSLAAISAMVCAPAFTYTFYGLYPALINVAISLLVIWRHRENIKRMRAGTEPKIGDKK